MSIINRNIGFVFLKSHKTASTTSELHLILNSVLGSDIYYTSREIQKFGLPRSKNNYTIFPNQSKWWFELPFSLKWVNGIRGSSIILTRILQHDSCSRLRYCLGKRFYDNSYKVTNVRNPWDALVSYYHWTKSGHQGRICKSDISWDDFLKDVLKHITDVKWSKAQSFLFYPYLFLNGTLALDDFIFFEDLAGSFDRISKNLDVKIKSFNSDENYFKKSNRGIDYRTYFSDVQAETVQKHFYEYLKIFPYSYDRIGNLPQDVISL